MKKVLLIAALLAGSCLMATAQDIITKKDGTDIKARVKEVSPTEVKYLRWDNQEGPLFILPASDVLIIRFENGSNYVMDQQPSALSERTSLFVTDPSILEQNGLKYNQLKRYYSTADYDQLYSPRYGLGYPWLNLIFPGLAIMITVLALNLFGDGIRDALDPRLK